MSSCHDIFDLEECQKIDMLISDLRMNLSIIYFSLSQLIEIFKSVFRLTFRCSHFLQEVFSYCLSRIKL